MGSLNWQNLFKCAWRTISGKKSRKKKKIRCAVLDFICLNANLWSWPHTKNWRVWYCRCFGVFFSTVMGWLQGDKGEYEYMAVDTEIWVTFLLVATVIFKNPFSSYHIIESQQTLIHKSWNYLITKIRNGFCSLFLVSNPLTDHES